MGNGASTSTLSSSKKSTSKRRTSSMNYRRPLSTLDRRDLYGSRSLYDVRSSYDAPPRPTIDYRDQSRSGHRRRVSYDLPLYKDRSDNGYDQRSPHEYRSESREYGRNDKQRITSRLSSHEYRLYTRSPSPVDVYRLIYFDKRGRAEAIRQLFVVADVYFVDDRVTEDEWRATKSRTPFQQLPLLDVDGILIGQTHAIMRFLARKFGFSGRTATEEAIIDSLSERFGNFFDDISPWLVVMEGYAKGDEDHLRESVLYPSAISFFECIEMFLKKAKGYLVGSGLSYVDLLVTEGISQIVDIEPRILDGHRRIEEYIKRIRKLPRLREWIGTRPPTTRR